MMNFADREGGRAAMTEEEWLKKKSDFKSRIHEFKDALNSTEADDVGLKKRRLIAEIEELEAENAEYNTSIGAYQSQILEKRREAKDIFKRSDDLKQTLMRFFSEENNLINELKFLEEEKKRYEQEYFTISEELRTHVSTLGEVVKEIKFTKGELETLKEKMYLMEVEAASKYRDIDGLQTKIANAHGALRDMHSRLRGIEKNAKVLYYRNRKEQADE